LSYHRRQGSIPHSRQAWVTRFALTAGALGPSILYSVLECENTSSSRGQTPASLQLTPAKRCRPGSDPGEPPAFESQSLTLLFITAGPITNLFAWGRVSGKNFYFSGSQGRGRRQGTYWARSMSHHTPHHSGPIGPAPCHQSPWPEPWMCLLAPSSVCEHVRERV